MARHIEGLQRLAPLHDHHALERQHRPAHQHGRYAGLPWDCILSAEVFRAYKPDPATYLGVARTFDLAPEQVMLVAAHQDDWMRRGNADCARRISSGRWSLARGG